MRARENEARATKCFRTLRRPGACFKSHATDLEVHAPRAFGGLKSRPQRGRRAWRRRGHHTCACRSDTCATRNRPAWPPFEFHLPDERSRVGISEMRTRVRPALKGHSRIARKLPKRLSRDEAASLL